MVTRFSNYCCNTFYTIAPGTIKIIKMSLLPSEYTFRHSPLSNITTPATIVVAYLALVFVFIRVNDARRKANNGVLIPLLTSPSVLVFHNLFLSIGSLIMFFGCAVEVVRRWRAEGSTFWMFCEREGASATGTLYFWSYIYYLSKYYELFDTFLGLWRGSRIPNFKIQVYHHVVVIFMAWAWCETAQSLQFIGLLFNTFVHVIMYIYFAASAGKWFEYYNIDSKWKKTIKMTITRIQITQFVTSFVCLAISVYIESLRSSTDKHCSGFGADSYYALYGNSIFNLTMLLAFLNVFSVNNKKKV